MNHNKKHLHFMYLPFVNPRTDRHNIDFFKIFTRLLNELKAVHRILGNNILFLYLAAIIKSFPFLLYDRSLKRADDLMARRTVYPTIFGRQVEIDGKHFGLIREIYGSKCYFPSSLNFKLKEKDTVVDLGCNVGIFTIISAKIANKVIAVEAQSRFIDELKVNLIRNNCIDNVFIDFAFIGYKSGALSEEKLFDSTIPGMMLPKKIFMEDIIYGYKLGMIDFLKIDIEGSEFDLFLKKNEWLHSVGKIAMEVHTDYGDIVSILEILTNYGFDIWLCDKNGIFVEVLEDSIGYLYARKKSQKGS